MEKLLEELDVHYVKLWFVGIKFSDSIKRWVLSKYKQMIYTYRMIQNILLNKSSYIFENSMRCFKI